ncbi:MAG: WD40 repeat domain-containing protein, partial [Aggregatilineales bacterium]
DVPSGKLIQHHEFVAAMKVDYHSSGQYLAVAHDELVSLLNPITGEIIYESDTYLAGMVGTFPKSLQFVTGSADGSIKLDSINSSGYHRIQNLVGPTTELLISNDERRIYIFEVFDVYILNVEKNEIIKTLFDFDIDDCPDYEVAEAMRGVLSRDNQYLVTNGESGMLNIFETAHFRRLQRIDVKYDVSMAVTHDDKYLVTVTWGQSLTFTVREMPTGEKILERQYQFSI